MVRTSPWILLIRCLTLGVAMSSAVSLGCQIDPFVRAEIESRTEALPGAAATIVCSNGSSWTGVYGEKALGSGRLIAADSVFQIASVSKTFAGVALALAQSNSWSTRYSFPVSRPRLARRSR